MEYFTLSEDLEEIQSSKAILRKRIIGVLIVLFVFFLLRGSGFITLEYNQTRLTGNHRIETESDGLVSVENNILGKINTGRTDLKTNDKNDNWNIGFNSKPAFDGSDAKNRLEKLIKESLLKEKALGNRFEFSVISVEKLDMSGFYWTPLIKNGQSKFLVSVQNRVYQDTYSANFEGEFDFEAYGICTIANLERIIAEKIARIVVDTIKEDYKK